ncbi:MAG: hypothetical protein AB7H66_04325 [Hyphomonadaceae bacterium]
MRKRFVLALAAVLSACAPAPVRMPAAQASEVLNLFASGQGPANICSANGRALLRGAVRSYSREMQISGVAWPAIPGATSEAVTNVDVSVMIAFAAGFVKADDFRGAPRMFMSQLALTQWPEIRSMRLAARDACEEVVALQRAAAAFMLETTRYRQMSEHSDAERLRRQSVRLQRAEERMLELAATVDARLNAHRS